MASARKLGLIVGTAITLGAVVGGCPQAGNNAPTFKLSETDGTEIRTINSEAIAHEYGWDEAIVLPMNREDIYNGDEKFVVSASDNDGPEALTGNFYPQDGTVGVNVTSGRNLEGQLNWNVSLTGDNVPRGTYPLLVGTVRDGYHTKTVGILGAISPGRTFTEEEPNEPYVIGDGICSPGEPIESPDCTPYVVGDGVCDPDKGEPSTSPDCQPGWIIGDGICSPGEPIESPDCTPYIATGTEFVNSAGNPVDPITTRTFTQELVLDRRLETFSPSEVTYSLREVLPNQRIYVTPGSIIGPIRAGQIGNEVRYTVTGEITIDDSKPGTAWDLFEGSFNAPGFPEPVIDSAEVYIP
ncbi:MAG: hypothetical protein ABH864_06070 [archaeon]